MRELGVRGWVRNLPDGRVEALVEGDDAAIDEALEFLRAGPRGARVTDVEVTESFESAASGAFEIRR